MLRGVVDAGVEVPHDEEKIVEEHLRGEHIVQYAENLGSAEEYAPKFSGYFANKLPPAKLTEHIEKVKANILGAFSEGAKPEAKKPQEPEKAEAKTAEAKPAKAAAKPAKAEAKKAEGKAAAKASGKSKAPAKAAAKAKTKKPAKAAKPAKSAKTKRKKA